MRETPSFVNVANVCFGTFIIQHYRIQGVFLLCKITNLLIYSIIFIILSSTILAFEQLSKIDYNRRNYQILDKMGVAQKTRRNLIKKEVGVLFFIPAILPMIIMIFLIAGANQVFGEAILQENLFLTYGIVTLAVFGGIYLLYYWATTSVFQYAVLKKELYR